VANWNLRVDIEGRGNDLAQSLKASAKHSRALGSAARHAKTEVRELGQASQTTTRHLRTLGREARTAARHINTLGDHAGSTARRLNRYGDAARTANRQLNSLGDHSRITGRQLARMSGQIDTAVRDLLRLADAARRADARMSRVGDSGVRGMRRYREETGRAREHLKSLAVLLSGGALTMGAADLVKEGGEYQQAMNAFAATTGATQMQMQRAAATADQLGNDLKLPGATASDAAEAMVELAKAGFRTDQAISATRASLVLASAAQVGAADSAKYLGDMMDQFGMGADQAGKAADTLAATANAASGDIIDIYYAMKYAGPVAHGLGVSMQETAAAVGMLGKAGILGQTAGTTLRGMMANLASPTAQMTEGLEAMGIQAWDAQGRFKGLRYVIEGLSKAQHHMTQQDFAAAVKKSMGKPAMSGAIALAHQGVDSFDALMQAVSQTGAASEIAAAKGKGLAGAMLQLKTQARQTGLTIYQGMAPGLEFLVRGVTDGLHTATPRIKEFFDYVNDAATLFGPDIAAAAREEFGGIADAVGDMAGGFKGLGQAALADFLHLLLSAGELAIQVLTNLGHGVEPVVSAFADLTGSGSSVSSTLDLVVAAADLAATTIGALSAVLVPIGHLVGTLVSAFGALPGPIQQFVLAAMLVNRIQPRMAALAGTVSGGVTTAFRSLNGQMAVQRSLAAAAGVSLTRYGAAMAVLQARVPLIGQMGASFRAAASAGTGFAGTLRGIGAASLTAARGLGAGLIGALGGPWGLAITAATVGLGFLAQKQQQAAQAAAEHESRIRDLAQALRESNGQVNDNVRQVAAQSLQDMKLADGKTQLIDVTKRAGIGLRELTDAYLSQGDSLGSLRAKLEAVANDPAHNRVIASGKVSTRVLDSQGKAAKAAADALGAMGGDMGKAVTKAKDLADAAKGTEKGTSAYGRLKDAVAALADKTADADSRTRALRDALDLLSGGSVSLQAAQARVNEAVTNANEAMAAGINKADGFGKALLNANGTLNTTTKNGQQLFSTFNTIADGASNAAVAAFDFAQSQGKSLPESLAAAQKEMQSARDSAIKLAEGYGLSSTQAAKVADSLGLIPGQVSILLQTEGVDQTLSELLAVQAQFKQFPDKKTIKVDTLGEDAKKELEDLGYKIKLIPGTREYKIAAPTKAAREQLDQLITKLSVVPDGKNIPVTASIKSAIGSLGQIQEKIAATKGKTITMRAPTGDAIRALKALGFQVHQVPGSKQVTITIPTGGPASAISAIQGYIDRLHGKTITLTTEHRTVYTGKGGRGPNAQANGSVLSFYADGGLRSNQRGGARSFARGAENHVAQFAPAGSWRMWAEPETGGEAYIPLSPAKRPRSRAIAEETIRRLGGDPKAIQWNADGNVTDWRYDPQTGTLYSASDAGQAGHKTKKVKVKVKGKWKTKEVEYFDISAVEKKLKSAAKATVAWNKDLEKVADRVGGDVAEALAAMGEDGMKLAHKMATGSTKYINDMAAALRNLQKTAKASLTDYTRQLTNANKVNKDFADDLSKLAAMGYGDLAAQLAAQGDEAAQQLADAAVKDPKKAAKANAQAKTANSQLTSEEVAELVQIISAIKTSKTGIHDVAGTTGLGEDEIITVATKAKGQISKSLGNRATKFLQDLGKANKHLAYADGGIRAGLYATQGGIIRFAEPQTGGEAYLPLSPSKRRTALPVLTDVARRFGVGLTDAQTSRVVIIREQGPLVGASHFHIGDRRSDRDLARDVEARQSYQLRRLARGGAFASAGGSR